MVVLTEMPNQAIIDGFKGVIDFYLWRGLPCARKWPVWRKRKPTPREKAAQDAFAEAMRATKTMPEYIIDQYRRMAEGTRWRWQDIFLRAYLTGTRY